MGSDYIVARPRVPDSIVNCVAGHRIPAHLDGGDHLGQDGMFRRGEVAGLKTTATCARPGTICLSSSIHLLPIENSKEEKPVMLPPGCARFDTKPCATGSLALGEANEGPRGHWKRGSVGGVARGCVLIAVSREAI